MKKRLLTVFILLLTHLFLFAQNKDTIQPDSLYRKYKIHFRSSYYEGSPSKSKEIFVFDRVGRNIGFTLTDNETGTVPQMKLVYSYNERGIISAESDTSFRGTSYAVNKADLFYGANGELIKEIITNGGRKYSEETFSALDKTETEKLYRNDSVYREQTSYYDGHNKKIRFTGLELANKTAKPRVVEFNGKKYTINPQKNDEKWDYKFENTYDNAGNLINQKRFSDGKMQDEIDFIYDNNGLLKEEVEKQFNNSQIIKFEYVSY